MTVSRELNAAYGRGFSHAEIAPEDLAHIERAASHITVRGARYPEQLEKLTGL